MAKDSKKCGHTGALTLNWKRPKDDQKPGVTSCVQEALIDILKAHKGRGAIGWHTWLAGCFFLFCTNVKFLSTFAHVR